MKKRWTGLLLLMVTATAVCLAQEGSNVSSEPLAASARHAAETKAVTPENTSNSYGWAQLSAALPAVQAGVR